MTATAWREPFLRNAEVVDSIVELADADRLVLYCGAGVTRDQTGLGWEGLVSAIFEAAKSSKKSDFERNMRIRNLISNPALEPQQKASIVIECLKPKGQSESVFLSRYLRKVLYEERGWGEGFLLRNIALLAVGMANIGRNVTIVTTNYDDYLLRRIDKLVQDASPAAPGLRAYCLGEEKTPIVVREPAENLQSIDVVFVHGFTPPAKSAYLAAGDIVFSEKSYLNTRRRTSDFLQGLMDRGTSFLTVGASVADPPLVEAIARGAAAGAKIYTLTDLPRALNENADDDVIASQVQALVAARVRHLGVHSALMPASFAQVAQFIEEIRVAAYLKAATTSPGNLYRTHGNYAHRLQSWWEKWDESSESKAREAHYELLAVGLDIIRDKLEGYGCHASEDEMLRLEMWVRLDPSVSREHRNLTLFANSSGPILDLHARREERIRRVSPIVSVKSFVAGKPTLTALSDLGYSDTASRWKTFLSVPLFHEVSINSAELLTAVTGSVPLGVISLSSSKAMSDGAVDTACFVDVKLGNEEYRDLLRIMIEVGREIVSIF